MNCYICTFRLTPSNELTKSWNAQNVSRFLLANESETACMSRISDLELGSTGKKKDRRGGNISKMVDLRKKLLFSKLIRVAKYTGKMPFLDPRCHLSIPIAPESEMATIGIHWEEEEPSRSQCLKNG